ncbi:MAG: hypothetical protein EHM52_05835, partial [Actinomycetota bacterium]
MSSIHDRYVRAEEMLPWNAAKLVRGAPVVPEWLDAGRFAYQRHTAEGLERVEVEVAGGTGRPSDARGQADEAHEADPATLPSPDGRWAAFVKDHDLWLRALESGEERRLTTDGEPYWDYAGSPEGNMSAVSDKVYGLIHAPVAVWSPDSRRLLTHKLDQRGVPDTPMLWHAPPDGITPRLFTYRQNRPGDPVVVSSQLVVIDVEIGAVTDFEHPVQSAT